MTTSQHNQLIQIQQPLPCGMMTDDEQMLCEQPTVFAYIVRDSTDTVPDERGYYRLLPVCDCCRAGLSEPPTLISEFDQTFTGRPNWEWE